jgi:UDP-N-acetylmuramate--alanine ligase
VAREAKAVCAFKVGTDEQSIVNAGQRFLSDQRQMPNLVGQIFAGHLRSIIGSMTVEDIVRNRQALATEVLDASKEEMARLGLLVDSFQIQSIDDSGQGYIAAMAAPNVAAVQREAAIAQAKADQAAAQARQESLRQQAQYERDTAIAKAQNGAEVNKAQADADRASAIAQAEAKKQVAQAEAEANQAGPLAQAQAKQAVFEAQTKAAAKQARLREQELVGERVKPAQAGCRLRWPAGPLLASRPLMSDVADDFSHRRLHFVGIGGAGMSGLALVAQALGAEVSGSDRSESSYSERLRQHGIEAAIGHAAANVPVGAEVVYSTAVPADNPERRAAAGRELHRADLLAQIASLKRCLAVTGTHGKTTTAGMVVHVLRGAGLDPAYVVGGELRDTGSNAGWGSGEWIVIEADESDRSLLKFSPEIAVLTNAELDHHSTYSSRLDLEDTFRTFMARAAGGAVVWNRPSLLALCPDGAVPYDAVDPMLEPSGARFRWEGFDVALSVPGRHNAVNAAGALTAAALAGADRSRAVAAIADFRGARRRFELLGATDGGVPVYDDYAHHPTEVAAVIAAARTLQPRRLIAVFQPHLYSRTVALAREFGTALAAADVCGVLGVYPSRERAEDFPGVDGRIVAAAAADAAGGKAVAWMPSFDDARAWLRSALRSGDLCLLMGAGDVDALGRSLVAAGPE